MKIDAKFTVLASLLVIFVGLSSASIVVNSQDWRDNALGISYSHFADEEVRMVTNLGEGQIMPRVLSPNRTHSVYTSGNPVWGEYSQFLSNNGLKVDSNSINWTQDQYRLYEQVSDEVEGFIVVKPEYGFDTISVFPKVVRDDYWLIYHRGEETEKFLAEEDKPVVFYGEFLDQPWLDVPNTENIISDSSRADNNKRLVNELLDYSSGDTLVVSGDSYFEKGFLKKGEPILLSEGLQGTVDIIREHNISIIQVIGAENVNFGNSIKDQLGDQVSVIAKFGRKFTGLEGLKDTYPIKKFPVETIKRNVSLENVSIDKNSDSTDRIVLDFSNSGNIDTNVNFSALELVNTDSVNQLISQPETIKLRQDSTTSLVIEQNISSVSEEAEVSFDYVGNQGLETRSYEVHQAEIGDNAVTVDDFYYAEHDDMIVVELTNQGSKATWIDAQLDSVSILNRTLDVLPLERKKAVPGDSVQLTYDVRMTESQLQDNSVSNLTLYTEGSERTLEEVEMDVRQTSITGSFMSGALPVAVAMMVLVLVITVFANRKTGIISDKLSNLT